MHAAFTSSVSAYQKGSTLAATSDLSVLHHKQIQEHNATTSILTVLERAPVLEGDR